VKYGPLEPFEHHDPGLEALKHDNPREFLASAQTNDVREAVGIGMGNRPNMLMSSVRIVESQIWSRSQRYPAAQVGCQGKAATRQIRRRKGSRGESPPLLRNIILLTPLSKRSSASKISRISRLNGC
jgi:hypothetical protein